MQITHSFSERSMPGWSHSIKQILQKMQQVQKVMLANHEQVDSLTQEPISKTWLFEMAFFNRIFYILNSRNLSFQGPCIFYNSFSIVGENFSLNRMKNDRVIHKTKLSKFIYKKTLVQNCTQLLVQFHGCSCSYSNASNTYVELWK